MERSMLAVVPRLSILACGLISLACLAASAQNAAPPEAPGAKPEMNETCPGLVASDRTQAVPVAYRPAALATNEARITYNGHSTFLIESPKLVRIATDFNDYVRPPVLPDIVTMNHAHSTHYTDRPDPDIKFVLRGWRDDGKPANHDISYTDVRVRTVFAYICDWNGATERNGNSIFIFEVG